MASFNRVLFVTVTLGCTMWGCMGASTTTPHSPVDIRAAAKQLVQDIRTVVSTTKYGQYIDLVYQDVLYLEVKATRLLESLPTDVSECETNSVIKMAAAGTGSHEVMTVMLARDALGVLNGRLALSLAFLEQLAGQLEDELTQQSEDVGPVLAAILFGARTTTDIIKTADKTVKSMTSPSLGNNNNNNNNNNKNSNNHHSSNNAHNRVRRQFNPSRLNLGSGFSLDLKGLTWQNNRGSLSLTLGPTFSGFKPSGFKLTVRF